MKYLICGILLSSCAVGERLANRAIDGQDALTEKTARESVKVELLPIVEGQKVIVHRMDMIAKESAELAHKYGQFSKIFRAYAKESNKFYIQTEKRLGYLKRKKRELKKIVRLLEKRIAELESAKKRLKIDSKSTKS